MHVIDILFALSFYINSHSNKRKAAITPTTNPTLDWSDWLQWAMERVNKVEDPYDLQWDWRELLDRKNSSLELAWQESMYLLLLIFTWHHLWTAPKCNEIPLNPKCLQFHFHMIRLRQKKYNKFCFIIHISTKHFTML